MKTRIGKAVLAFALILIFSIQILTGVYASAGDSDKTVRVGVFESVLAYFDDEGNLTGYAYDYLQEISNYTGWKYEYVKENWTDLMDMLERGEIDMLYDVSYVPERAKKMLYSKEPMGVERAYIYVNSDDNRYSADNLKALDGKRIGITGNDVALDMFLVWENELGIKAQLIEYEDPSLIADALKMGKLDACIQTDAFLADYKPLVQIGQSNIYFALPKGKESLKDELDLAMKKIMDVSPDYNNRLYSKYNMKKSVTVLPEDEVRWLDQNGPVKIGYCADYAPFCKAGSKGELSGALKDYFDGLKTAFDNVKIEYEAIPYVSAETAIEALKRGQIDCVFPVEMRKAIAEQQELSVSEPLMTAEVYAVVKKRSFSTSEGNVASVPGSNKSFYEFVVKNYPNWQVIETEDLNHGIDDVLCGRADCIIMTNYRVSLFQTEITHNGLFAVTTGNDMEMCFAFNRSDNELYSIISRYTAMRSDKDIYESLASHAVSDKPLNTWDVIHSYFRVIATFVIIVLAIIILLLIRSEMATRKAKTLNNELKELLESSENQTMQLEEAIDNYQKADLERRTDFLTGLRNRQDLFGMLQTAVNGNDEQIFAMYMIDIDCFKSYNDTYGHVEGDRVLKKISRALMKYGKDNAIQFYRYGGEEILGVLVSDAGKPPGEMADEIVKLIRGLGLERSDVESPVVTISLGYTCDNKRYEKMIDKADEAMYYAKSSGKNKASCYENDVKES